MSDQEETVLAQRAVDEAMALVNRLVTELPAHVEVFPGFNDEEMDAWKVTVPEDVRLLLRRMSGLDLMKNGFPWYLGPDPSIDVGADMWRLGPAGTFWVLHFTGAGDIVYVDVDAETGRWGPVFLIEEECDVVRLAPSLAWYVAQTTHQILVALEWAREDEVPSADLKARLAEFVVDARWETLPSYGEGKDSDGLLDLTPQPAETLRQAEDPVLAGAAAAVPEGTLIADLQGAGYPARIEFAEFQGPDIPFFERSHCGRFVYAFAGRV